MAHEFMDKWRFTIVPKEEPLECHPRGIIDITDMSDDGTLVQGTVTLDGETHNLTGKASASGTTMGFMSLTNVDTKDVYEGVVIFTEDAGEQPRFVIGGRLKSPVFELLDQQDQSIWIALKP